MKKFLSLVLALVMTMSLVTISAGATEFKDLTDVNSIEHKEAVELFNKIGIITGYEDGSFGPEKTITREQAAKIIAIMALGNDAASKLGAESAPFPDVPATSQFAGYIGYCVSAGIIDGYKDGTFKPKGTLTGYQFAKMLLGVLGYGVNDEYVGTNWALNVARDGATIGLFDNATVTAGLINRDNATQIAFNALKSNLVTYSSLLGTYTAYNMMTQTLLGTLAENIFGLTTTGKQDGYGYNTHAWRQNGKVITGYYMTDKIIGTETDSSLTGNQLFNAYSWDVTGNVYANVPVYVNGTNEGNWDPSVALKSVATKYIGKGYTVNFVDVKEQINGVWVFDGNVEKIVVTIPYLAKVEAVNAATSSTNRSVNLTVYAEGAGSAGALTVNKVETENFAKGDYILITPSSNTSAGFQEPLDMVKAQTVEGTVTAFYKNDAHNNNGSVTVDGVKYNYNFIFAAAKDVALGDDIAQNGSFTLNKGTYTFFLDNVGNVIGLKVKDSAVSDYAYIIAKGEDAFQMENIAKVLTSDGKIATYNISSKSDDAAYQKNAGDGTKAVAEELYSYSINANGEIVLSELVAPYGAYDTDATTVNSFTKGYSVITTSGGIVYATDETVFMYYNPANGNVTTYTGKSNAPSITSAKDASVAYETKSGVNYATFVVIAAKAENSLTDNYVYSLSTTWVGYTQDANGDPIYYYDVIMNGAKVTIASAQTSLPAVGVYQYAYNEAQFAGDTANNVLAGVYDLAPATAGVVGSGSTNGDYKANVAVGVSSNDNVMVSADNKEQFVISPETKITDISDKNNIVTDATIAVGDTITVVYKVVSGLQVADAVYITAHMPVTIDKASLSISGTVGTKGEIKVTTKTADAISVSAVSKGTGVATVSTSSADATGYTTNTVEVTSVATGNTTVEITVTKGTNSVTFVIPVSVTVTP